ncbi:Transcription initiation factor TFIID subunit 14 [Candida viswanathii]|uniref:Transcription initiation factor TFIID subunit 14 n=1 Tax=Candida viswanathii TaxID=5486 RepID=A0A367YP46_9ASCO|nr:Transcription initiation factor TFIID subunit 14 [Candida viswanathii]
MSEVKRTIRITTEQHILTDEPPVENHPMRLWAVQISVLDAQGNEHPAKIFDKVTYSLHPTFANPQRTIKQQPFRVEEKGWGEFDIPVSVHILGIQGKAGERKVLHDLNFAKEKYYSDHEITIPVSPTRNAPLNKLLTETGPLPFDERGAASGGALPSAAGAGSTGVKRKLDSTNGGVSSGANALDNKSKKSKGAMKGNIDLEKLSQGLTKLSEDDLIVVVQMVTDNRTNEMNIKNDVENGEFTMDLYTLPDSLLKSLWDYVKKHTGEA